MVFNVTNCGLNVGSIDVIGISSAALFLIGDADTIQLSSAFDTPPESLIIGALVPFVPQG
ncbi:spore gernimation protein GerPD [Peribacillus glennii]|uniref:Spore gernimation protein GerPD n=1 Tax=Peribacillus glennii TaxID=2303991 RepID=A0A372L9D6_9BACI|nr:spore gernimation protein GerPD [Peribacillus glennii]RFU62150.1 spore gernimation protein GerPD [Peribacillus glennii]